MKYQARFLCFMLLATAMCANVQAQLIYSIDSTSIVIGDQATLTIGNTDVYPGADQLSQDGIVVLGQWFDTLDAEGGHEVVQRSRLTCFDAGEHCLKLGEDDSLIITVRDVANVDTTSLEIKDIAGTMSEPYTFCEIFRWVLLGLLIAALIAAAIYVIRRYRAHEPILQLPKAPPIPPHEQALKALNNLRISQLWQQGKVKEYHTQLTDIVRNYIESAFGVRATDMTSNETLEAFAGTAAYTAENKALLQSILATADMVKFAKSEPLPYEHDRSMSNAVAFVEQTKPVEPTATEEPNLKEDKQ